VFIDEWLDEVADARVNRRGWVLQERLLAPRVLHFAPHQLYWECKELSTSEMCRQPFPRVMSGSSRKEEWDFLRMDPSANPPIGCHQAWMACVAEFSQCALTFPSDKLVALSGIARVMYEHLGGRDTYFAGLWKSQLFPSLLWRVTSPHPVPRVTPYRAPTWSWASLDSKVEFSRSEEVVYRAKGRLTVWVAIQDVNVKHQSTPETNNRLEPSFGIVVDGALRIRGPLFRLQAVHPEKFSHFGSGSMYVTAVPHSPEKQLYSLEISADECIFEWSGSELYFDFDLYCLPFYTYENSYGYVQSEGLLLVSTKGQRDQRGKPNTKGEFKRFGTFCCSATVFLKILQRRGENIDKDFEFEEDNGGGDYTIIII
jgi:hypothetical protein